MAAGNMPGEPKIRIRAKSQLTTMDGIIRKPGDVFSLPEREALGYVGEGQAEQVPEDTQAQLQQRKDDQQDYTQEQSRIPEGSKGGSGQFTPGGGAGPSGSGPSGTPSGPGGGFDPEGGPGGRGGPKKKAGG